jgi:aspartyl-tRNA(Asn)/glutamyl-tRNA(Gln) amidotransferase subunit A
VISNGLSATGLLREHLTRIHRDEAAIRAWATLAEDEACRQAREVETKEGRLPLAGMTVGIKDIIDVAGMPTQAGSPLLAGYIAARNAACVQQLGNAGAVILGKTATTEFAFYDPAPTRNPRNLAHTPGGSSSGSAAAVAAGFCTAAIGTQTFGSVIRPASYCGVFGLKPTYDAVPREGVLPLAWSLDHVGIFARSASVAAAFGDVLFSPAFPGERPGTIVRESGKVRWDRLHGSVAGTPDRYFFENLDPTVRRGYDAGLDALARVGVHIRPVELPTLFEPAIAAAGIILRVEAATFHRRWYPARAAEYGPKLRSVIESGGNIPAVEYLRARQVRRAAIRQMLELMNDVDFLVSPSTPTVAPKGLVWTGDPVFNTPFSVFGFPAMTLPASYSPDGLPSGFQVAGRPWSEGRMLRLAVSLEEEGFGRFKPPRIEEKDLHGK